MLYFLVDKIIWKPMYVPNISDTTVGLEVAEIRFPYKTM